MERFFYLPSEAVVDFLREEGQGSKTKDYEFIAAIVTNRFCERQWQCPCEIGFPVNAEAYRVCDDTKNINLKQVTNILRNELEENSPVDFAIRSTRTSTNGMYVQVKRFGIGRKSPDTDELIDFLNGLKYQQLSIALIVVLETESELELKRIQSSIDQTRFPFERLIFILKSDTKLTFVGMFPESGMEEYEMESFL